MPAPRSRSPRRIIANCDGKLFTCSECGRDKRIDRHDQMHTEKYIRERDVSLEENDHSSSCRIDQRILSDFTVTDDSLIANNASRNMQTLHRPVLRVDRWKFVTRDR